jgi:hypothetical protein
VWTCTFQAQSGGVFHIVWRESGNPEGWVPPSAWGSHEWESLDGVMNQLKTTTILLGQKPVLIR